MDPTTFQQHKIWMKTNFLKKYETVLAPYHDWFYIFIPWNGHTDVLTEHNLNVCLSPIVMEYFATLIINDSISMRFFDWVHRLIAYDHANNVFTAQNMFLDQSLEKATKSSTPSSETLWILLDFSMWTSTGRISCKICLGSSIHFTYQFMMLTRHAAGSD